MLKLSPCPDARRLYPTRIGIQAATGCDVRRRNGQVAVDPNNAPSIADAPAVLLVEDEPLVRIVASDVLADGGFRTLEACSAQEALTLLEAKPAFVALVTDVRMPGSLDGFGLAQLVASRCPGVGIVVVSGHACPGEGDLPEHAIFLRKPYQPSALLDAVRRVTSNNIVVMPVQSGPMQGS